MTDNDTDSHDAEVTIQNDNETTTVTRDGRTVEVQTPDETLTLTAPDEAEQVATAIQTVVPGAWK